MGLTQDKVRQLYWSQSKQIEGRVMAAVAATTAAAAVVAVIALAA